MEVHLEAMEVVSRLTWSSYYIPCNIIPCIITILYYYVIMINIIIIPCNANKKQALHIKKNLNAFSDN